MALTKSLKLSSPIDLHEKPVKELLFKEPSGGLYLDLGEPRLMARNKDMFYWIENDGTIKSYLEQCVQGEDGAVILHLLPLKDARRAKDLILSFFTDADQAT